MPQYEIKSAAEVEGKDWLGDDGYYVVDTETKQNQFFRSEGEAAAFIAGQKPSKASPAMERARN